MHRTLNGLAAMLLAVTALVSAPIASPVMSQTIDVIEQAREQALVHLARNEKALATAAANRALFLAEAKYGTTHPVVADCLEVLTGATGDSSYIKRALAIREATDGEMHEKTARTLLLISYGILDKPEAEAYLKRAIAILEHTGPKQQLGETLSMLSAHYVLTKRLADAEALKPRLDALEREINR
jgi:hypothetical protein